jgi:hypothetical protein
VSGEKVSGEKVSGTFSVWRKGVCGEKVSGEKVSGRKGVWNLFGVEKRCLGEKVSGTFSEGEEPSLDLGRLWIWRIRAPSQGRGPIRAGAAA